MDNNKITPTPMRTFKRTLLMITALGLLGFASAQASAATFKYTDMITISGGNNVGILNAVNASYVGEFNILPGGSGGDTTTVNTVTSFKYSDNGTVYTDKDGFVPGMEKVTSPSFVSFYFRDDNDSGSEVATIALENNSFNSGSVTLNSQAITFVQIGGTATIFTEIDADGKLSFTINRNGGDFYLDYARLDVNTVNVPDGGTTSILLGASFLALAGIRNKLKR